MKYTNNEINRILRIREFVEICNTLSKIYLDFDKKNMSIDTINDKDRIFKVYCSSVYNLIDAIEKDKQFFDKLDKYLEFDKLINEKYVAEDNKYFKDENHQESLYLILNSIRNQCNHSRRDEDDNNLLFDIYIDFNVVDHLRILIDEMFYETFNTIDKKKLKEVTISKQRIKYSVDKIKIQMDQVRNRVDEIDKQIVNPFKEENSKAFELFEKMFTARNIYDLLSKDGNAFKKLENANNEMQEMMGKVDKYYQEKGTDLEREAFKLLKNFFKEEDDNETFEDYNNRVQKLQTDISKLKEKYNK